MASTRASISKASKKPKINIIPPKQLFMDLTHDDTKTPSPTLQLSSPSAPNAPSKTPSTKDTSSSLIDYIPKSPTSSTSLSPNGYLNSPTSPPPRVSPPPPTQENASMDITLTLSPITPLEAHGDSCLCCIHNRKDIKVKKSKNEQKPTRNEETSTRERFEANIESRIKTVVEKSQGSKEKDKGKMTILPLQWKIKRLKYPSQKPNNEPKIKSISCFKNYKG
ncbi:hypothetical protein Tco_0151351 [Tanacetum coccineum]